MIPFAVPGFLSLLVWQGLLNDDFGVVNNVLNTSIPWLFDPVLGKGLDHSRQRLADRAVLLPRPMGVLQSIPAELTEAARVDGGVVLYIFRRVTLPLLPIAVAPLLIASFAFNFNNFGNIYLLTGGGPAADDQSVRGRDPHPDHVHLQYCLRVRQGERLRARERRLDHDLLHRGDDLGRSPSGRRRPWRRSNEQPRPDRARAGRGSGPARGRGEAGAAGGPSSATCGGVTSSPSSRSSSRSSRSRTSSPRPSASTGR